VKNFLALNLLAVGTPMLLMGDEVRRTQRGNNNAYCINDDMTWFDWDLLEKHADVHRFVKELIALRVNRNLPTQRPGTLRELLRDQPVTWHGVKLNEPDWGHESHSLAATATLAGGEARLYVIVNAFWEKLAFELPSRGDGFSPWLRIIDTAIDGPDDVRTWTDEAIVQEAGYSAEARSVVLLVATRQQLAGRPTRKRRDQRKGNAA
jgi:glycogen operon protein